MSLSGAIRRVSTAPASRVRAFSTVKFLEQKRSGEETVYFKKEGGLQQRHESPIQFALHAQADCFVDICLTRTNEALLRRLLVNHPEADPKFQHTAGGASVEALQSALALCVNKHLKVQAPKALLDELSLVFLHNGWTPPPGQTHVLQPNQPTSPAPS
ncbi:hypothetical protein Esti_002080 [Eimeria stiedai]